MLKRIKKKILLSDKFIDNRLFLLIWSVRKIKFKIKANWVKIEELRYFDKNIIKILKEESIFYSKGIETWNISPEVKSIRLDKLSIYMFENALINTNSSAIYYKSKLIVDKKYENERFDEGFVLSHGHKKAIVNLDKVITIKEAFFLGGNGSWNWYHFLIELAPKLIFIKKFLVVLLL